jgi:hypothetical protein
MAVATGADRQTLEAGLSLPAVDAGIWYNLAANVEVQERAALLLIARLKKQAKQLLAQGDAEEAARRIEEARRLLTIAPASPEMKREEQAIAALQQYLRTGSWIKMQKHASYESRQSRHSKF